MYKGSIKVIKRKDVTDRTRVAAKAIRVQAKINHKMVETVNGWIFDHQIIRNREKDFSNTKIMSWELVQKD